MVGEVDSGDTVCNGKLSIFDGLNTLDDDWKLGELADLLVVFPLLFLLVFHSSDFDSRIYVYSNKIVIGVTRM